MIVVTGGAGFIGSNLVKALCAGVADEVVVVDDLEDGRKFANIAGADVADYLDKDEFLAQVCSRDDALHGVRALFHLGACSDTTQWDGRYMMRVNYEYSKRLLEACARRAIPFIYASSAAVYGGGASFREVREDERPINVYGYSKFLFDQYVRRRLRSVGSQVVGLRYFNVYGPGEDHKGRMASVALHLHRQLLADDEARLFEGCDGYDDGEQRRDFVHVDDAVDVNLWFLRRPDRSGIYNVGTGRSQSFNAVARAVIGWHGRGSVRYVAFPDELRERYQSFTQADLTRLRAAGYDGRFMSVEQGVPRYLDSLATPNGTGTV